MGKYFGTDGFRGEANKDLTNIHAYQIGRFLGWYFSKDGKPAQIVIGKDTRRSGYMLEYALVTGISASGGEAYMMHVTTTPSVAYITRTEDFDCGIMISASHNSFEDNGIKLFNSNGEKVLDELIDKIEAYIDGDMGVLGLPKDTDIPLALGANVGKVNDHMVGRNRYMAYLINLAEYSYKGMKVGLDTANGASYAIARSVFEALGAKVTIINNEPDGTNINVNCGSTHMDSIRKLVVEKGLDIGFAFDGDADRCLIVDERGNIVDGDQVLYIYAKYMKDRGKLLSGKVCTTIMSNFGLYKAFDELGIDYEKTAVGDKYVYEKMVSDNIEIGGENSGHTIFRKYATTGDGILTAMKVMQVMLAKKAPLSTLTSPMTVYPQVLKNVRVKSKPVAQNDPDVQAQVALVAETLGNTGRILVRESGTEQLIRVMVEAESIDKCHKLVDSVVSVLIAKGHGAQK